MSGNQLEPREIPQNLLDQALGAIYEAESRDSRMLDGSVLVAIPAGSIQIDLAYQRKRFSGDIKKMADDFRYGTPVVVSLREDQTLWAVDGQGRIEARIVSGGPQAPIDAMVKRRTYHEEAREFGQQSQNVRAITPKSQVRAFAEAGEPWAVQIRDAMSKYGLSWDTNTTGVVGIIDTFYNNPTVAEEMIQLAATAWMDGDNWRSKRQPEDVVWKGIFLLLVNHPDLDRSALTEVLWTTPSRTIKDDALQEAKKEGRKIGEIVSSVNEQAVYRRIRAMYNQHVGRAALRDRIDKSKMQLSVKKRPR